MVETGRTAKENVASVRSAFGHKASVVNKKDAEDLGIVKDCQKGNGMGLCLAGGRVFVASAAKAKPGLTTQEIVTNARIAFAALGGMAGTTIHDGTAKWKTVIADSIPATELSQFLSTPRRDISGQHCPLVAKRSAQLSTSKQSVCKPLRV